MTETLSSIQSLPLTAFSPSPTVGFSSNFLLITKLSGTLSYVWMTVFSCPGIFLFILVPSLPLPLSPPTPKLQCLFSFQSVLDSCGPSLQQASVFLVSGFEMTCLLGSIVNLLKETGETLQMNWGMCGRESVFTQS